MNYYSSIVTKILIIILGVMVGVLLYNKVVNPYVLRPLCLTDSNSCMRIAYWNHENSVLFHWEPSGYWCWFNGEKAFVFDVINGAVCKDKKYQPVFPIEPYPSAKPENWVCVENVNALIDKYENTFGVSKQYLWKRPKMQTKSITSTNTWERKQEKQIKGPVTLTIYDILNLFADRNVINLQNISK